MRLGLRREYIFCERIIIGVVYLLAEYGVALALEKHRKRNSRKSLYLVVAIIIIAVAAAIVLNGGKYTYLNASKSLTIRQTPTLVGMNGAYFAISFHSYSSNRTDLLISELPIFIQPEALVSVGYGNATHVNIGGKYANLEIKLDAATPSSANVTLIPVDPSLGIAPDSAYITTINPFVAGRNQGSTPVVISNASTTQTTTSIASTSTTTIAQETNKQKAMNVLERSTYYSLMQNYTEMYANDSSCTSALYNSSYNTHYGYPPRGLYTYQNTSLVVPYKMNMTLNSSSTNIYTAIYRTYSHESATTGMALEVGLNITSGTIISVVSDGVFYGDNFTTIFNGFKMASSVGNACGIMIA